MSQRELWEIELSNGRTPVSRWIQKNLDNKEKGRLSTRLHKLEVEEVVPKEWLTPYISLKMIEIKFTNNNRAIRFLCHEEGNKLIMLLATQKNGQITPEEEERAVRLRSELKGDASVRRYPLPQRP